MLHVFIVMRNNQCSRYVVSYAARLGSDKGKRLKGLKETTQIKKIYDFCSFYLYQSGSMNFTNYRRC